LVGEQELKPVAANGMKYRLTEKGLLMEAANVRERPAVAVRKGPLFDIRGSVLAEVRADGRRATENVKPL
jgi:hypothetical protein